ncbi:unnamed protein product [Cylindrotheca closterium]|uniref:Bifunctional lysine-specific demethylase and histidyl-hydroxylase n=1 Tax=Cylindrotheca closterium TaxID=2856 RepID=A0AAD2CDC3_9STRA|nr:unnamed protein product [Cylindrotheca closterium]
MVPGPNDDGTVQNGNGVKRQLSKTLRSILKSKDISSDVFLQNVWQKLPVHFPFEGDDSHSPEVKGEWRDDEMQQNPFEESLHQSWHILKHLLEQAESRTRSRGDNGVDHSSIHTPLIFQNRELKSQEETQGLYGSSLFAPYLDGCSVVLNHGDLLSPWIAAICQDLQSEFPHVYANTYLTPPDSQAVPPHADDRDVFILQLVGSKQWKVYERVPIPYPYPDEQVGKEGIPVHPTILNGPLCIDTTLQPGDVLYMPRGFVHEASSPSNDLSFHVTIAIATHDWSLAGLISRETNRILTNVIDYRQSTLPLASTTPATLQSQLSTALSMLQEEITVDSLLSKLHARIDNHNQRAVPARMALLEHARNSATTTRTLSSSSPAAVIVGPLAAMEITFTSVIRAATPEERASVTITDDPTRPRGLQVRPETYDTILSIIGELKKQPDRQCRVLNLQGLLQDLEPNQHVCDLTLLSLAKRGIELGAMAVVQK